MVDGTYAVGTWIRLCDSERETLQGRYESRLACKHHDYRTSNPADYRMRYPLVWNGTYRADNNNGCANH